MALKHTAKPLVEEHYHIDELIDAQEKRAEDREYHRQRVKNAEERSKIIDDAKMLVSTDFHCIRCRQDFKANAVLQVEQDWSKPSQMIAFYKSKHRLCGAWAIRNLTDKHLDGFWQRSRAMRLEQGKYHNDLLQPFETGYNMLYGKR